MPEKLSFYDVKSKKKFESDQYEIVIINNRRFAKTKAPSGIHSYRILGMKK